MKHTFFAALLSAAILCPATAQTIQTIAGGGPFNLPSIATGLAQPSGAAVDSAGNLYVSLAQLNQVWKFTPNGSTSVFAGNGSFPYDADNVAALSATLLQPSGLAFDTSGNLYVADSGHNRIRKITPGGIISTVAGNGVAGYFGDGAAATAAQLHNPTNVAVDRINNILYIVDSGNNLIRAVSSSGIISTFAGNITASALGDGGPATSASLNLPTGVAIDSTGTVVYIADSQHFRVRKVAGGVITTYAGNGTSGHSGDNGSATSAQFIGITAVTLDSSDNLFIVEPFDVREILAGSATITPYAGTGTQGYSGDGGSPIAATFQNLVSISLDSSGNAYLTDAGVAPTASTPITIGRVRKIASSVVTTFAGNGTIDFNGNGLPAVNASLLTPNSVAVDNAGSVYFTDGGSSSVRRLTLSSGQLSTPAGSGLIATTADGQAASGNPLANPSAVTVGPSGLFFAELYRVRKVSGGLLSSVANTANVQGMQGDGGPATGAQLNSPSGLALAPNGDLYIADSSNNKVRLISAQTGTITTIAGTGTATSTGDNGLATGATLNYPSALALDGAGNLFVAELLGNRVRKIVLSSNIITTAAGDGSTNFADGVSATSTGLYYPFGIFADDSGNLFIADEGHYKVRKVAVGTNLISTVAGNGTNDFAGDGGAATAAAINPLAIAIDRSQTLYIADGSGRIRSTMVSACFFTPGSLTQNFSSAAGSGSITFAATNASCPYTAASNSSFLSLTSAASGSGSGTITFSVSANTGSSPRSGTITIGSQIITVNQGAAVTTADSISPNTGSGTAQNFTAVFSSTSGAGNLASEQILINSGLNNSLACSIYVNSAGFFLFNDAGSNLAGPAQSGMLSNSQCVLSVSGSSVSSSGNSRTVSVSLTFTQAFVGAKYLYLSASDTSGNSSGFQNRGSYTIPQLATVPTSDSVSPNAGSGSSQAFSAVYSDTAGYGNLTSEQLLLNSSLSNTNACSLYVNASGFYLFNDAGNALMGPVAQGGMLSNSQCTLSQAGSSVSGSGTSRTVVYSLSFSASFAGSKNLYLFDANASGNNSGFQNRGTYTVPTTVSTPSAVSISPNAGSGTGQVFTATYSDSSGYMNLTSEQLLINSYLTNTNACSLYVNSSGFYLFNDAGNVLMGPAAQGGTLTNSQCTFSQAGSSVSGAGNNRTVVFNLSFSPSFGGAKSLFLYATNTFGNSSGFQNRGTYTTPLPGTTPTADSISPSSGSGSLQSFTAVYSDADGYANLTSEQLLINSSLTNSNACSLYVNSSGFYLFNDAGTNLMGPAPQGGTLSNSQCTVSQAGTSASGSGNSRTVVFSLSFSNAFGGAKNLYTYATNTFSNSSGFQNRGTYTVPFPPSTPTADSVSPSSGSGTSQVFTAIYSDPNGYSNLASEQLLINSSLSNSNGCSLYVNSSGFYLFNDAGTVLMGPAAQSGTLSNSQCTFSQAGSSVSGSGNSRTVTFNLSFSNTFHGAKTLYLLDANAYNNSGFQNRGTFNIQ